MNREPEALHVLPQVGGVRGLGELDGSPIDADQFSVRRLDQELVVLAGEHHLSHEGKGFARVRDPLRRVVGATGSQEGQ